MTKQRNWWSAALLSCACATAVAGCSDDSKNVPDGEGGSAGGRQDPEGGSGGDAGETPVGHSGEAGSGQAGEGGHGGDGGHGDEARAIELLGRTVEAQLGSAEPVTDAEALIGKSFVLDGYLGPSEDWDGWPGEDETLPEVEPPLLARASFVIVEDGESLALVSALPSEVFTYAERLPLERRGDAWLVRGLTTSIHSAWTSDGFWSTASYQSAVAVLAFKEEGVVIAATNGYDGDTPRDDLSDVAEQGTFAGLATSYGLSRAWTAPNIEDVAEVLPLGDRMNVGGDVTFNDRALLALEPPVADDSAFHFEDDEGARAEARLIRAGDFVVGVSPEDYLPEGWKLVGSGTGLDGEPFDLSIPVKVVLESRFTGDIETDADWRECPPAAVGDGKLLATFEGRSPLAGTRSLDAPSCSRFRIARAPNATELELSAVAVDCCSAQGESWKLSAKITSLGPQGATATSTHQFTSDEAETATFTLPDGEGDLLVELRATSKTWLDSLRTK